MYLPDFVDAVLELRSTFKSSLPGRQIYLKEKLQSEKYLGHHPLGSSYISQSMNFTTGPYSESIMRLSNYNSMMMLITLLIDWDGFVATAK